MVYLIGPLIVDDGEYIDTKIIPITVTQVNCYSPNWYSNSNGDEYYFWDEGTRKLTMRLGLAWDDDGDQITYHYAGIHYDCNNIDWPISFNQVRREITLTVTSSPDHGMHRILMYAEDSGGLRVYKEIGITKNDQVMEGIPFSTQNDESSDVQNKSPGCAGTVYYH